MPATVFEQQGDVLTAKPEGRLDTVTSPVFESEVRSRMNASRVLSNYMALDNDRQLPIISSLVLTVTDITLDVLIAVMGGGTFGMGLATSISHNAEAEQPCAPCMTSKRRS